jgi:hypothetical protein
VTGLAEITSQAAAEMTLSLARTRTALSHSLSKGEAAEETVRKFFARYLPPSLGVTKGQVIDSLGRRTKQLDVIVYDMDRTPTLFSSDEDGHRLGRALQPRPAHAEWGIEHWRRRVARRRSPGNRLKVYTHGLGRDEEFADDLAHRPPGPRTRPDRRLTPLAQRR